MIAFKFPPEPVKLDFRPFPIRTPGFRNFRVSVSSIHFFMALYMRKHTHTCIRYHIWRACRSLVTELRLTSARARVFTNRTVRVSSLLWYSSSRMNFSSSSLGFCCPSVAKCSNCGRWPASEKHTDVPPDRLFYTLGFWSWSQMQHK